MTWLLAPLLTAVLSTQVQQDMPECAEEDEPYCLIPIYCWSEASDPGQPVDTCPWVFEDPKEG